MKGYKSEINNINANSEMLINVLNLQINATKEERQSVKLQRELRKSQQFIQELTHQNQACAAKREVSQTFELPKPDDLSLEQLVHNARVKEVNDRRNFESPSVMSKWRKEDENIKSFIYKMNIGKKLKIWKQPTFFQKSHL